MLYLLLFLWGLFFLVQLISPHRISTFITCWQHIWQIAFCWGSWGGAICFFSGEPCLIHNGIFLFRSLGNSTCVLISYLTPKYIITFRQLIPPLGGPESTTLWRHQRILHPWQQRPRSFLVHRGQVAVILWVWDGDSWRYLRRQEETKTQYWMFQCISVSYMETGHSVSCLISDVDSHTVLQQVCIMLSFGFN